MVKSPSPVPQLAPQVVPHNVPQLAPRIAPRLRYKRRPRTRYILELLAVIGLVYVFMNLATARYVVDGSSMEPTFKNGEMLLTSRVHYLLGEPMRGDLVVFRMPDSLSGLPVEDYIKRIIGLPGETITLRDTLVFVNGELLTESYIAEPCSPSSCPNGEWTLGSDEYFVMGDNRNASSDSRRFREMVRREHLIGKVVLRYWPLEGVGFVGQIIGYPES